ncbi:winged helix-turn-helix domain-containing protein, partial [Burkholderia sp. LMG 13014]
MTDLSSLPASRDTDAADRSYIGLARQIHAMVAAGAFEAGARLPSERSLADQFGVSRTQVREAIIALEVQGVVEVRIGSG